MDKLKGVKWWVWLIVAFVIVSVFNADKTPTTEPTEEVAVESQQPITDDAKETISTEESQEAEPAEEPQEPAKAEEKAPEPTEPVRLEGRGQSEDGSGRAEPQYVGITGYVVVGPDEIFDMSESSEKFPKEPWTVPTVKQVGDNKFEETEVRVPHKTKVKVIEQTLEHEGWGNYEGALLVENLETKEQFLIDAYNFMNFPYWEDPIEEAIKHGYFIAVYNGNGEKPALQDGEWVELDKGVEVVVEGKGGAGRNSEKVEAKVYKEWKLGYGGVDVYFDPASLEIKY